MDLGLLFNLLFLTVLTSFKNVVQAVEGHSQAFIQTDKELRYLVDTLHFREGLAEEELPDISSSFAHLGNDLLHGFKSPIIFEPPMLDFGEQSVGIPHMERVVVFNPSREKELIFTSISGSTVHFHCSFFQDKIVQPGGNTTFDVVFLARQVGNVENTLYIHTSLGSFQYQVFGVGTPNPYRLRPFLGARVPVNSSFSPLISMHNPHSFPIQVIEMYSSGGDLHLELPSHQVEAPNVLWEIPPYETKPVMRANFVGRVESNHTAYIRIKTNKQKDDYLILPVEVEVLSVPGLYSTSEILDFGILRMDDDFRTLDLNLLNSGLKPVHITNVTVSHLNEAIKIDFKPIRVPPDTLKPTTVAKITFSASKASDSKHWKGKILVKTKINFYKLSIPYQATVLFGTLKYNRKNSQFFVKQPLQRISKEFQITNTFNFSVVIHSVILSPDAEPFFKVSDFSKPVVIGPQQQLVPFSLEFQANSTSLHLHSSLQLRTNISDFTIPLVCYDGKLKFIPQTPGAGSLDFGTLGMGDHVNMMFTLRNDNPVDIVISSLKVNLNGAVIELAGIEKGNGTVLTKLHHIMEAGSITLKSLHFGVFILNIIAPVQEGYFSREITIITQYQTLKFPVTLRTAEGSLSLVSGKLIFDYAFPGRSSAVSVPIQSSFSHPMDVKTLQPLSYQNMFSLELLQSRLEPKSKTTIGRIRFDPLNSCKPDCYVGLPTHLAAGHQWLSSLVLPPDVSEIDVFLYNLLHKKWESLVYAGQHILNVTFQLDTTEVRGLLLKAQAYLHWPWLITKRSINFPLTQCGNTSITELILENPSALPILVQILFVSLYPNPWALLELLHLSGDPPQGEDFSLNENLKSESVFTTYRKAVESYFGLKPHKKTVTFILRPGSKVPLKIGFSPRDERFSSSILLIRNNLTVVETIVVQGQGGGGILKFGNRRSGSSTPLLFEMTEKHLKDCEKSRSSKTLFPNFTVKRAFTARNSGGLPLYIQGFSINGSPCEGYGFKVLNCDGFELQPNASKKIDIAFTPDFTMSRVQRTLLIHSSLGHTDNFSIVATIPQGMMAACTEALPRPPWELVLYYISIICMFTIFCVTIIVAVFDANKLVDWNRTTFDRSKILNFHSLHLSAKEDLEGFLDRKYDSTETFLQPSSNANYQQQMSKETDMKSNNLLNDISSDAHTVNPELAICKNTKRNNRKQNFDLGQNELNVSNGNVEKNLRTKPSAVIHNKCNILKENSYQRKLLVCSKNKEKLAKKKLHKQKIHSSTSDNEETCSSTTESSSLDSDLNEKDVTSSPFIHNENNVCKKSQPKCQRKAVVTEGCRVKSHKKGKTNSCDRNTFRSSSLKLPYRLEPLIPLSPDGDWNYSEKANNWLDSEVPENLWDPPNAGSHDEDFSELSLQTECFAMKQASLSYSKVVSGPPEQLKWSSPGTIGEGSKLFIKSVPPELQPDLPSPIHGTPKTPAPPFFLDQESGSKQSSSHGFLFESGTSDAMSSGHGLGDEWPGFNLTLPSSNSWWDEVAEPLQVPSVWGRSANSVWPSTVEEPDPSGSQISREFDPFNSLSSIWSSNTASGGATWTFQNKNKQ